MLRQCPSANTGCRRTSSTLASPAHDPGDQLGRRFERLRDPGGMPFAKTAQPAGMAGPPLAAESDGWVRVGYGLTSSQLVTAGSMVCVIRFWGLRLSFSGTAPVPRS